MALARAASVWSAALAGQVCHRLGRPVRPRCGRSRGTRRDRHAFRDVPDRHGQLLGCGGDRGDAGGGDGHAFGGAARVLCREGCGGIDGAGGFGQLRLGGGDPGQRGQADILEPLGRVGKRGGDRDLALLLRRGLGAKAFGQSADQPEGHHEHRADLHGRFCRLSRTRWFRERRCSPVAAGHPESPPATGRSVRMEPEPRAHRRGQESWDRIAGGEAARDGRNGWIICPAKSRGKFGSSTPYASGCCPAGR